MSPNFIIKKLPKNKAFILIVVDMINDFINSEGKLFHVVGAHNSHKIDIVKEKLSKIDNSDDDNSYIIFLHDCLDSFFTGIDRYFAEKDGWGSRIDNRIKDSIEELDRECFIVEKDGCNGVNTMLIGVLSLIADLHECNFENLFIEVCGSNSYGEVETRKQLVELGLNVKVGPTLWKGEDYYKDYNYFKNRYRIESKHTIVNKLPE